MNNKELEISFEEKLYLKRICEDFKIYCDFWSEFTSKIIFDIETLALIVDYKNEKYMQAKNTWLKNNLWLWNYKLQRKI